MENKFSENFYKRYYPKEYKVGEECVISEIQEKIINVVKGNQGITQSEIARRLGESKQVVNYHLKLLEKVGKVKIKVGTKETKIFYKEKLTEKSP